MKRTNGPWTINERDRIYHDDHILLYRDDVIQPDGKPGQYSVIHRNPGASVLALDDQKRVYLVRLFRYALGEESLEVVGGAIDDGEDPVVAARRELVEEAGIEAAQWTALGATHWDTSQILSPIHLFLARSLSFLEPDREGTEEMERVWLPLDEAVEQAMTGQIVHGTTCLLLLKTQRLLAGESRSSG
ncbi:MAG: NUDIX hydrolase [Candidatus Promineifilaceae bacterium]|nr:NUDIX hydrolase [Candidatus Promineifilaceae bacterium]